MPKFGSRRAALVWLIGGVVLVAAHIVTYALSGVVAGLLGALCWFHLSDRRGRTPGA